MENRSKFAIYKLANNIYQTSYFNFDGKRTRNKFNSYKDAKNFRNKILVQVSSDGPLPSKDLVTSILIDDYLKKNPNSTIITRGASVLGSFTKTFGKMQIGDISKNALVSWLKQIREEKKYSSRSMLQIKYAFTPFFDYVIEKGILRKNMLAEIKIRKGTRAKERIFLSETELKQIAQGFEQISPTLTYPITYFIIHTGCKIGEALSLKWEQLDLEKGTVHFYARPNCDERTLNLSKHLADFFKSLSRTQEYIFLDENRNPWKKSRYGKRLARDRAHIGLARNWDNFTLRHSFAYHFLRKGGTLQRLQVVLGHRNIYETILAYGSIFSKDEEKLSPY